MFPIDIQSGEASYKVVVQRPFLENVDPSALPAIYGDARILAGDC